MDADLQHPSATIIDMIDLCSKAKEDVYAKRNQRKGSHGSKKTSSKWFIKY